ncbi:hypothetical protein GGF31_008086 [Allomyces arbusculus]|nr:hypothetical protein GGF31_008086 [Allomyces arbusculus]
MMAHRKNDGLSHAGKPSPDDPVVVLARGITAIPPMQRFLINNNPSMFRKAVANVPQTMNTKSLR